MANKSLWSLGKICRCSSWCYICFRYTWRHCCSLSNRRTYKRKSKYNM